MMDSGVEIGDLRAARERIAGTAVRTPLLRSPELGRSNGADVLLKLDNLQRTGSFKLRGAANLILGLSGEERARGVVAVSSGNHGKAVSFIAGRSGIRALICLPASVPRNKVDDIRSYGAEVVMAGRTYDEAIERAYALRDERGLMFVHPYDDPRTIAGQGTIGLELLEDSPDLDTVLVPLSGGGLIAGVALAVKTVRPSARVVGVMMERSPVMYESLRAGRIVELQEEPTLADALAGGLGLSNQFTFKICRDLVDDIVLVTEEEIADAMAFMLVEHHVVVEGGGAVGVAAARRPGARLGKKTAVVVSGGNVDLPVLREIMLSRESP